MLKAAIVKPQHRKLKMIITESQFKRFIESVLNEHYIKNVKNTQLIRVK
jgi:hypothetical protein